MAVKYIVIKKSRISYERKIDNFRTTDPGETIPIPLTSPPNVTLQYCKSDVRLQ